MRLAARLLLLVILPALLLAGSQIGSGDVVDLGMLTKIREEGFGNSKVMDTSSYLCDVIGARLTGSPSYKAAHEWTMEQLEKMGLKNAHLESWEFGRGWDMEYVSVHMVKPDREPLIAIPRPWAPGTNGPVTGKVVRAKMESEQDFEKFKGKLQGAILLLADPTELKPHDTADLKRHTDEDLARIEEFAATPRRRAGAPFDREAYMKRQRFMQAMEKFLVDEKVLAGIMPAAGDGGTLKQVQGGNPREPGKMPVLYMAAEHYNRISRILDQKIDVELELNIKVNFPEEQQKGLNTIADIPGTDLKDQIVLLGGHLDSWHAGTGATDDAAGVAVAMEAARILQALEVKPRRTIRVALWGGEEQGLLGSRDYVKQHVAARPEPKDPEQRRMPDYMRGNTGPLELKSEHSKISAYFNLDNGTGKIRGIYLQGNAELRPIFESWLRPIADLGAKTVTMRRTSGTDHLSFDGVGVPGFQFIQDEVEYNSRTWHSNMDVYDRLQRDDLMQASVVMAWFVYNTAMRDEMLPRKPMPKEQPRSEGRPASD